MNRDIFYIDKMDRLERYYSGSWVIKKYRFRFIERKLRRDLCSSDVDECKTVNQTRLQKIASMERESFTISALLINCGADVSAKAFEDWTPLHLLCYDGLIKTAILHIISGADVNARDDHDETPLYEIIENFVVKQEYYDIIQILVDMGAGFYKNHKLRLLTKDKKIIAIIEGKK